MKMTVVPAQVTTVEDRIIGNLSFTQLLLLVIPLFLSAGVYCTLPPFLESALYKYIVMGCVLLVCLPLALRIKGKTIAAWLITILRYRRRPRMYVWNKNALSGRTLSPTGNSHKIRAQEGITERTLATPPTELAVAVSTQLLSILENPAAQVRYETTKKGGLRVRIQNIQQED